MRMSVTKTSILTPGIVLESKGDSMGQQYRTPREAVLNSGCDVIIVGRGIYRGDLKEIDFISARAERYMSEGWAAYKKQRRYIIGQEDT